MSLIRGSVTSRKTKTSHDAEIQENQTPREWWPRKKREGGKERKTGRNRRSGESWWEIKRWWERIKNELINYIHGKKKTQTEKKLKRVKHLKGEFVKERMKTGNAKKWWWWRERERGVKGGERNSVFHHPLLRHPGCSLTLLFFFLFTELWLDQVHHGSWGIWWQVTFCQVFRADNVLQTHTVMA